MQSYSNKSIGAFISILPIHAAVMMTAASTIATTSAVSGLGKEVMKTITKLGCQRKKKTEVVDDASTNTAYPHYLLRLYIHNF